MSTLKSSIPITKETKLLKKLTVSKTYDQITTSITNIIINTLTNNNTEILLFLTSIQIQDYVKERLNLNNFTDFASNIKLCNKITKQLQTTSDENNRYFNTSIQMLHTKLNYLCIKQTQSQITTVCNQIITFKLQRFF
jgi:hypothetical protein